MALLFLDSFDHYSNGNMKYLAGGTAIVAGRHGNGYNGSLRCALNPVPTHPRCIFGMAVKLGSTFGQLMDVSNLATMTNSTFAVQSNNNGSIQIALGGGQTAISAPDIMRVGQWQYIEIDATTNPVAAPSSGYSYYNVINAKIYVDGALVVDAPSLTTSLATGTLPGPAWWDTIDITPNFAGAIDDLYISDGAGPAPWNGPLGDIEIGVIRPNALGLLTEWTPVGVAANWDTNNDINPDGTTTHVVASTAPKSDLYEMEDVSTGNTIIGAQILINACRTEEGFGNLAPLIRHSGVTTELTSRALSTTFFYRNRETFVTMPNGAPLLDVNINNMQAGFKRTT